MLTPALAPAATPPDHTNTNTCKYPQQQNHYQHHRSPWPGSLHLLLPLSPQFCRWFAGRLSAPTNLDLVSSLSVLTCNPSMGPRGRFCIHLGSQPNGVVPSLLGPPLSARVRSRHGWAHLSFLLLTSLLKDGFYLGSLYAFFQATLAIRRNLQKLTIPTAAISGGLTIAPQGSHC